MKAENYIRIKAVSLFAIGLVMFSLIGSSVLFAQKGKVNVQGMVTHSSDDGKYTYFTSTNDPLKARIYYLKNGLTVYLSVNKAEPRINTSIAVKAGSTSDPADATGLAHYLEHMLFKGTDQYGSLDYSKEKPLLDKIEDLYEKYRSTKDEKKRKEIYAEIDKVSGEAAKFAIANEYDKMLGAIGAKGTNAYTSFERTVYINDIPSNQLEKWLMIEGERFRNPVLRLFHTELEAVYEEKNNSIDNDGREAYFKMMEMLFPEHNYGQQTTIGTIEHLKNPSIKKIKEYFGNYYVPNNMAICVAGDFDPDQMIVLVDKYFGHYQSKSVVPYSGPKEQDLTKIQEFEMYGPDAEMLYMGYRLPGIDDKDKAALEIISLMLSNSTAGLIDLNLVQKQKVLTAYSFFMPLKDYGVHAFFARPKEGQSMQELKDLLIGQLDLIKKGEFDNELIDAIVNNYEIDMIRQHQSNRGRVGDFVEAFITNQDWHEYINYIEKMREVTRDDVINIANKYYADNYAVVYKKTGEKKDVQKVEKPAITAVEVNRDAQSEFLKKIVNMPAADMAPRFLNYASDVVTKQLDNNVPFHYVKNDENNLFTLYYLFDFGSMHDRVLAEAVSYLSLLGTDKYSAEDIAKQFYNLGTSFDVFASDDQVYVYVSGLQQNFDASIELFEHVLNNAKADAEAWEMKVENILKSRADAKLNKQVILWVGMMSYAKHGEKNPFNSVLSEEALRSMDPNTLTDKVHNLSSYEHKVMYYGPENAEKVVASINKYHKTPEKLTHVDGKNPFAFRDTEKRRVYFVDFKDMVKAEVAWVSKSVNFEADLTPVIKVFNEYYGGGMSSIVFQTIRESKALAYGTYAVFSQPSSAGEPYYLRGYVGTQADKLDEAIAGMNELLKNMPSSENLFDNAKMGLKNQIETERIIRTSILFNYLASQKLGLDHDIRKDVYDQLDKITFDQVSDFHKKYISGQPYNLMILGSKDKIDLKMLEKYGEVIELNLEQVFGY